jgi:hypothetical protein
MAGEKSLGKDGRYTTSKKGVVIGAERRRVEMVRVVLNLGRESNDLILGKVEEEDDDN